MLALFLVGFGFYLAGQGNLAAFIALALAPANSQNGAATEGSTQKALPSPGASMSMKTGYDTNGVYGVGVDTTDA